jgi:histidine triad (HIT) family protein
MPKTKTSNCLFCEIVSGNTKSYRIYEDSLTLAFLDHRPLFHGHTLLIPKKHFETVIDLPHELMEPLFSNAQKIAKAFQSALGAEGSFIAINNFVSQSVPHLHLHIVPRTKGDGLKGFFWPRTKYEHPEQIEEIRNRLQKEIQQM